MGRVCISSSPAAFWRSVPVAFLDPQYRGVLDHLAYGNEGVRRGAARAALPQMTCLKM